MTNGNDNNGSISLWGTGVSAGNLGAFDPITYSTASKVTFTNGVGTTQAASNNYKWAVGSNSGPLTAAYLGGTILLGPTSDANAGTYTIASLANNNTVLKLSGAGSAAIVADTKNGQNSLTWTACLPGYDWAVGSNSGPLTAAYLGGTILLGPTSDANAGTYTIASLANNNTVLTLSGPGSAAITADSKNGQASLTWSAVAPLLTTVTVTGLTGVTSGNCASTITLSGSSHPVDNGTFTVLSCGAGTATITTGSQVNDSSGTITWQGGGETSSNYTAVSSLWSSLGTYDQIILPCSHSSGFVNTMSAANQTLFYEWMGQGGKAFADHWTANGLFVPQNYPASNGNTAFTKWVDTATFNSTGGPQQDQSGQVLTPEPPLASGYGYTVAVPTNISGTGWISSDHLNGVLSPTVIISTTPLDGQDWASTAGTPELIPSGLVGLTNANDNNGSIVLWGTGVSAGNLGAFEPITYVSATSTKFTNAAGTTQAASNNYKWAVGSNSGPLTAAYLGGTILLGPTSDANAGTYTIASLANNNTVLTLSGPGSAAITADSKNGQNSLTWTAWVQGTVTITGLTGVTPAMAGDTITFFGANNVGNDGAFKILTAAAGSVTISNLTGAVGETTTTGAWMVTNPAAAVTLDTARSNFVTWLTAENAYAGNTPAAGCGTETTGVCTPTPVNDEAQNRERGHCVPVAHGLHNVGRLQPEQRSVRQLGLGAGGELLPHLLGRRARRRTGPALRPGRRQGPGVRPCHGERHARRHEPRRWQQLPQRLQLDECPEREREGVRVPLLRALGVRHRRRTNPVLGAARSPRAPRADADDLHADLRGHLPGGDRGPVGLLRVPGGGPSGDEHRLHCPDRAGQLGIAGDLPAVDARERHDGERDHLGMDPLGVQRQLGPRGVLGLHDGGRRARVLAGVAQPHHHLQPDGDDVAGAPELAAARTTACRASSASRAGPLALRGFVAGG